MELLDFLRSTFGKDALIEELESGFYSKVMLVSHGDKAVVKLFKDREGMRLSVDSATILGRRIKTYHGLLRDRGIVVPERLDWVIEIDSVTNRPHLILFQPYCGVSAGRILLQGDVVTCRKVTVGILNTLEPLFATLNELEDLGIDAKADNFTTLGGPYTFVDLIPPRYSENGNFLIEYPEPKTEVGRSLGRWRYYSREGVLTVLLTQLARIQSKLLWEFVEVIEEWLSSRCYQKEVDYLQQSTHEISSSLIENSKNPVKLRLFMCALASRNGTSQTEVDNFFRLTHFEDVLSDKVINKAQQQLISLCTKIVH
jgi:hypothetical protein